MGHASRAACCDRGLPAAGGAADTAWILAANSLGRHALGSRSGLQRDADGSLTIHVGHRQPNALASNWLPAPDAPFYLVLRLYHPQQRLLEGRYPLPLVERVG